MSVKSERKKQNYETKKVLGPVFGAEVAALHGGIGGWTL